MTTITQESLRAGIRSLVPGRLRLRHECLAGLTDEYAVMLEAWLRGKAGVTDVVINRRVGSLLLTWDDGAADWTLESLLAEAEVSLAWIGAAADESEPSSETTAVGSQAQTSASSEADCGGGACASKAPSQPSSGSAASNASSVKDGWDALSQCAVSTGHRALDCLAPFVAPDVKKGGRKRRVTQNRLMGGALGASMATLLFRSTAAHVWTGGAFLAFLAVHLWQHRKVL